MKGVILAAGKGTRLKPLTNVIPKMLLPVYDKPMIYYSIDLLMATGIKDIMVVVSQENGDLIRKQLGDGSEFGANIKYEVQKEHNGSAMAFKLAREFVGNDDVVLMYGDNIFLGDLKGLLEKALDNLQKGYISVFAYQVEDPRPYGVLELDDDFVKNIFEKPEVPISNLIAPGLYFYDSSVFKRIEEIGPSPRGEYEMSDVNNLYVKMGKVKAVRVESFAKWYDAGNKDVLLEASNTAKEKEILKKE